MFKTAHINTEQILEHTAFPITFPIPKDVWDTRETPTGM